MVSLDMETQGSKLKPQTVVLYMVQVKFEFKLKLILNYLCLLGLEDNEK